MGVPVMQDDELLTIPDVAKILKMSEKTVRRYIQAGDLIVHEIGGKYRISRTDLNAFLKRHRRESPPDTPTYL